MTSIAWRDTAEWHFSQQLAPSISSNSVKDCSALGAVNIPVGQFARRRMSQAGALHSKPGYMVKLSRHSAWLLQYQWLPMLPRHHTTLSSLDCLSCRLASQVLAIFRSWRLSLWKQRWGLLSPRLWGFTKPGLVKPWNVEHLGLPPYIDKTRKNLVTSEFPWMHSFASEFQLTGKARLVKSKVLPIW